MSEHDDCEIIRALSNQVLRLQEENAALKAKKGGRAAEAPPRVELEQMEITLERQIYKAIRGRCISDASAERAAAQASELAIEKLRYHAAVAPAGESLL